MCPEKRRMVGKKHGLDKFMDKGEKIPDKRNSAKIAKKAVDKIYNVGVDTYGVYTGRNG
ncbi:hypothetical protein BROSI_A3142 [Candidatus Brocadia sinica JPN1]|uniref:Uncharacterized protein n=1 Tax=Candidatus Brocadia sinica JPN1 TaxID=1197129 RepID=A0ABQ0K1F3_9BACT|nr:hypothetical protein BROSI_A3142 [Candidatus Brocadia sinica JPN1]GIK11628.1 MAG: hypothetical protein BroJett002_03350 [Candidatus Brocadia sinica]GJQ19259.1 MAG: hypothetical protein HBSIN01_32180 [Candidatus Brocadia sinica]